MKKKLCSLIFTYLLCLFLFLSIINIVTAADPTVGEIKLTPTKPTPQSDVTVSSDISGSDVSKVRLIINECNKQKGICLASRNITMNKKSGNTFETTVTLQWEDATSITYHISLESYGKWIEYDEYTTLLSTTGSSNDSNGSPGFEIIVFLIAIIGFVIYVRKIK
ncbi:MAG: hypothetical protein AYK22_09255 [Thermoplasmatales archaeon SG8-52-3]|nr:MAG: hypothetical protein AYK22_09255 [Thermoplasmatales archaeon SG8-52-3]